MIGNRRILREPIAVIVLTNPCIDVFLILVFVTRQLRGELRRRLSCRRWCIAALPRRLVECDVLNALARRRRGQTLSDLHLACEIALVRLVRIIPELVCKRIQCLINKLHIIFIRRIHSESRMIRRQRDAAVRL